MTFKGSWLDRFSSTFISTVLGITITLGIGMYRQSKEKAEFVYKSEVLAMHSINDKLATMDHNLQELQERFDAIYAVAKAYPDSISALSYEQCDGFIRSIFRITYNEGDDYAAQVFNSSADMWVKAKNITEIASINQLFALTEACQRSIDDIYAMLDDIRDKSLAQAFEKPNIYEGVRYILSDVDTRFNILRRLPLQFELAKTTLESLDNATKTNSAASESLTKK